MPVATNQWLAILKEIDLAMMSVSFLFKCNPLTLSTVQSDRSISSRCCRLGLLWPVDLTCQF